ncbi:class I SAM-dependent methyltransferase, partial [Rhodoblastus sp.]|uniref:class I SAM-dependent methyltransferase n=1 Tax=Rhodoblastus sp. TaxID=1962975 RepID=UPI003F94D293
MNNIRSVKSNASVIRSFDAAARTYDTASDVQRKVARELVLRASRELVRPPKTILDLGCGAGHVTDVARQIWPEAKITGLDAAPGMLKTFRDKFPGLTTLCADAANLDTIGTFDLILSSMMLHWLPEPTAAVAKWRQLLAPGGKLNVAVPVEGSLVEWRDFLRAGGMSDGL